MLHTDIPTPAEVERLAAARAPWCVTIDLPTTPVTADAQADRIAFGNLSRDAIARVAAMDPPRGDVAELTEALEDLRDDDDFWAHQARSLVVLATHDRVRTYRLPNRLTEGLRVADRFDVKGLVRAITFPQVAFVLLLSEHTARLLQVTADLPVSELRVPDLEGDDWTALGASSRSGRIQGGEGRKVRLRQWARYVDHALRDVLAGRHAPLILACTAPLDSIFRAVCTYPHLADEGLRGKPEELSESEVGEAVRPVLDALHAAELEELRSLLATRANEGRAAHDLSDVARAATYGAVDTLLVDLDADVPGGIDEASGALQEPAEDGGDYGITDEIVARTLRSGGRVLAVRADDVPGEGPAAAILRYAV